MVSLDDFNDFCHCKLLGYPIFKYLKMVVIFLSYIVSSIIFTFPLILKLGEFLPGQPNDAYVYLWNIGNFWSQVFTGSNPFFTQNVMYPIGANLFFHTYAPLISLLAFPFLKDLSLFMGIVIISAVVLSCLTTYFLIFKITNNKRASFIGGLVYGISPIIHSFIESQHYFFLFSAIFYPVGILFLIKFIESKKLKFLALSISLFWIVLSIDYYSTILYSLLIATFFLTCQKLNWHVVIKSLLISICIILIPFILIYKFDKNFNEFISYKQGVNTSSSCHTDLLGFITPNITNPFIGFPHLINLDTPSYYLGWGILLLAIISVIKNRKQKYIKGFAFIFAIFFFLSLGTNNKFHTPFYYFLKIPILGFIDCPIRFPIILQLCLSVFVATFISNHKKIMRVFIIAILLLIIEYGVVNKNFSSTTVPAVYKHLSFQKDTRTILEIPSGISESKSAFGYDWSIQALHSQQMYWQTIHNKPRVGIYMSRLTPDKYEFYRSEPVISDIFTFTSAGGTRPEQDIAETDINNFIKKFNLGYIILSPNTRQLEFSDFIEKEFSNFIIEKRIFDNFIFYKLLEIHS